MTENTKEGALMLTSNFRHCYSDTYYDHEGGKYNCRRKLKEKNIKPFDEDSKYINGFQVS